MNASLKVSLTETQKAWLSQCARLSRRSQTAEIKSLLDKAMKANPLTIHVREEPGEAGPYFYATISSSAGEAYLIDSYNLAAVSVAVHAKAKELGLRRNTIDWK